MSKKTSPQSRRQRRPRTRSPQTPRETGGGVSAAAAERSRNRRREANAPAPTTFTGRLRRFLPTVLVPNVVVVLSAVVVALAVLMLSSTEMSALPTAIAQLWLGVNLVPLQVGGTTVGLLPLLPAMGLVWLLSRQIHRSVRARVSIADLAVLYGLVLLVPLVLGGVAMGMLWDASSVYEVSPPKLLDLLPRVLLLHTVAMCIGMGSKLWRALCRHYGLPEALVSSALRALRFLGYLLVAASVVLVLALALGWRRQLEMAELYNGGGAIVGLIFVSLLYLPNALAGVMSVLLGAEFHIGETSVSLFSIHHTPLPPMPLVAAIPAESIPGLHVLLVIPALIAGYLAYRANPTLVSAIATGVFAALFTAVLGYLAQGSLGEFGPTGPMIWLSTGLVLVWVALAGVTTTLLFKLVEHRQRRAAEAEAEAEIEELPEEGATAVIEFPEEEETEEAEESEAAEETAEDGEDSPEAGETTGEEPSEAEDTEAEPEDEATAAGTDPEDTAETAPMTTEPDPEESAYIDETVESPEETDGSVDVGESTESGRNAESGEEAPETDAESTRGDHNEGGEPPKG